MPNPKRLKKKKNYALIQNNDSVVLIEDNHDKVVSENNQVAQLKRRLLDERRHRLKAIETANVLREQNEKLKRKKEEEHYDEEVDTSEVAAKEREKEVKGYE